eukprot:8801562-Lingulodinium_polyedra.AAC.1
MREALRDGRPNWRPEPQNVLSRPTNPTMLGMVTLRSPVATMSLTLAVARKVVARVRNRAATS